MLIIVIILYKKHKLVFREQQSSNKEVLSHSRYFANQTAQILDCLWRATQAHYYGPQGSKKSGIVQVLMWSRDLTVDLHIWLHLPCTCHTQYYWLPQMPLNFLDLFSHQCGLLFSQYNKMLFTFYFFSVMDSHLSVLSQGSVSFKES